MGTAALYTEINHVINTFGAPFFQLLAVRAAPIGFFFSSPPLILDLVADSSAHMM